MPGQPTVCSPTQQCGEGAVLASQLSATCAGLQLRPTRLVNARHVFMTTNRDKKPESGIEFLTVEDAGQTPAGLDVQV